ncbi:MAG: hypothetical protein Q8P24_08145 [Desulfobacterales bacterium]|nr:hypothetical protein [Desulfobacterales bacterium]
MKDGNFLVGMMKPSTEGRGAGLGELQKMFPQPSSARYHPLFGAMKFVFQALIDPHSQCLLYPFVNRRPAYLSPLFNLGDRHAF